MESFSPGSTADSAPKPPQYGRRWSHGLAIAAVISLGVWLPAYFAVTEKWADAWWCDFAGASILVAAFLSLSWLTCAVSEFLEKRDRIARD